MQCLGRDRVEEHRLSRHLGYCCKAFDLSSHRQLRPGYFGADVAGHRPITVDVLGYTILRVDTGLGFVGAAAKATDPAFGQVRVGIHLGQRGVADEAGRHP